jgi:hypothetical protein
MEQYEINKAGLVNKKEKKVRTANDRVISSFLTGPGAAGAYVAGSRVVFTGGTILPVFLLP